MNTYVASQAAVPIQCYNQNPPSGDFLNFFHTPAYLGGIPALWDSGTANVYPGWLSTNVISCGARVNFYNTNDYALSQDAWQFDETSKPDSWGVTYYKYEHSISSVLPFLSGGRISPPTHIIPSPARRGLSPPFFRLMPGIFAYASFSVDLYYLDFEYNLNNMYEVMAYASEARTLPLGRFGDTGVLERRLDLSLVWLGDSDADPNLGIYGRLKWHSAEFNFNYLTQNIYWANLIGRNGFTIFSDR